VAHSATSGLKTGSYVWSYSVAAWDHTHCPKFWLHYPQMSGRRILTIRCVTWNVGGSVVSCWWQWNTNDASDEDTCFFCFSACKQTRLWGLKHSGAIQYYPFFTVQWQKTEKPNVETLWSLLLRGELLTAKRKLWIGSMGAPPPPAGSVATHVKRVCDPWFNWSMNS
jgi:hypothetical protein